MADENPLIHTESMAPAPAAARSPLLTNEQIALLQTYAEEKFTAIEIAEKIGATVGTVSRYAKRFGLNVRLGGAAPTVRPAIVVPSNGNGVVAAPSAPSPTAPTPLPPAQEPVRRRPGRPRKHVEPVSAVVVGPVSTGTLPGTPVPYEIEAEADLHIESTAALMARIRELETERAVLAAQLERTNKLLDRVLTIVEVAVDSNVKPA